MIASCAMSSSTSVRLTSSDRSAPPRMSGRPVATSKAPLIVGNASPGARQAGRGSGDVVDGQPVKVGKRAPLHVNRGQGSVVQDAVGRCEERTEHADLRRSGRFQSSAASSAYQYGSADVVDRESADEANGHGKRLADVRRRRESTGRPPTGACRRDGIEDDDLKRIRWHRSAAGQAPWVRWAWSDSPSRKPSAARSPSWTARPRGKSQSCARSPVADDRRRQAARAPLQVGLNLVGRRRRRSPACHRARPGRSCPPTGRRPVSGAGRRGPRPTSRSVRPRTGPWPAALSAMPRRRSANQRESDGG